MDKGQYGTNLKVDISADTYPECKAHCMMIASIGAFARIPGAEHDANEARMLAKCFEYCRQVARSGGKSH